MKLKVPFYKQTTLLNCGPVALQMVFSYFSQDIPIELIEEKTRIKEGKAVSTITLATASAELGFKVKFFSKSLYFNEENFELDFYKKYSSMNIEKARKLIEEARKKGVEMEEKTLSLEELLSFVTKDSIPIVLLDWNVVLGKEKKGYQGHFVPVVGYDKENVYVHNHGFIDTRSFFSIKKEIFDSARKARGTDEDVLIICRKEN